jgi:hypothetical protein
MNSEWEQARALNPSKEKEVANEKRSNWSIGLLNNFHISISSNLYCCALVDAARIISKEENPENLFTELR